MNDAKEMIEHAISLGYLGDGSTKKWAEDTLKQLNNEEKIVIKYQGLIKQQLEKITQLQARLAKYEKHFTLEKSYEDQ